MHRAGGGVPSGLSALRQQYEPLPWDHFWDAKEMINETIPIYTAGTEGHIFLCMHGAGNSAMSFSVVAETLKTENTVISFDWRGHGEHQREDETNMPQATLVGDAIEVLTFVHDRYPDRTIVMVGHSMGGAIAAKTVDHLEK